MAVDEPAIYDEIPRAGARLLARLQGLSVADLYHNLPAERDRAGLFDASLRPLRSSHRMCGLAVTAHCAPNDSLLSHAALYHASAGDVLADLERRPTTGRDLGRQYGPGRRARAHRRRRRQRRHP